MAIYRRQPYDYGAKFGNTAQNVLSAILGVKGFKGSQAASAAGAELDMAQAAKVAQEAKLASELNEGYKQIGETAAMANRAALAGNPDIFSGYLEDPTFSFYTQGSDPIQNRAGRMRAWLGEKGSGADYLKLYSQTPQDIAAGQMWANNPELAQIRAATEGMQKASTIPSVTIPGQGMRIYAPGGKQTGTRPTEIGGKMLPMPYEEIIPPSLGEPVRLTSEGNVVGKVTPEQALEAIAATKKAAMAASMQGLISQGTDIVDPTTISNYSDKFYDLMRVSQQQAPMRDIFSESVVGPPLPPPRDYGGWPAKIGGQWGGPRSSYVDKMLDVDKVTKEQGPLFTPETLRLFKLLGIIQ